MRAKHAFKPTAFDHLESREVLSAMLPSHFVPITTVTTLYPTATVSNTMANLGSTLNSVYQAYQNDGGNASQLASQFSQLQFQNGKILVTINGTGNFSAFESSLTNLGMQITTASSAYDAVTGYLPITALPTVSLLPQATSVAPVSKPIRR
jgi:hypothetical protein